MNRRLRWSCLQLWFLPSSKDTIQIFESCTKTLCVTAIIRSRGKRGVADHLPCASAPLRRYQWDKHRLVPRIAPTRRLHAQRKSTRRHHKRHHCRARRATMRTSTENEAFVDQPEKEWIVVCCGGVATCSFFCFASQCQANDGIQTFEPRTKNLRVIVMTSVVLVNVGCQLFSPWP